MNFVTTYCPSTPAIDLETGEHTGWWYAVHIRPEDDPRTECQVCGMKFSAPNAADGEGKSK